MLNVEPKHPLSYHKVGRSNSWRNIQHSTFNFLYHNIQFMKKLYTLFIIAAITWFGLSSCSDEAFDVDSVNKQTILVFMPWSGSESGTGLYSNFKENLDSINRGIIANKGLKNSRVLVFLSVPEKSSNNLHKSYLYELQYNSSTKEVETVTLDTYDDNFYTKAEGITALLNEVKEKAEALNYAMIIGGHGCGWTYATDWQDYPNNAKSMMSLSRFCGSVSDINTYGIDIPTLAKGIEGSGIKLQYILFDACYMGNVETAYELRNATNYLIASTSEVMDKGMPYYRAWNYLCSSAPNYSSIVSSFNSFYTSYSYPYGTLAAIDCRQMDKLAALMKELNANYTITNDKLAGVQRLDGFTQPLFYDLGNYVDSLAPSGVLKDQFNTQLNATVKSAKATENIVSMLYHTTVTYEVKDFSGLTISDPSSFPVAQRGKEKTSWWKATH